MPLHPLKQHRHLHRAALCPLLCALVLLATTGATAQCVTVPTQEPIVIHGTFDSAGTYGATVTVRAEPGTTLSYRLVHLREEVTNRRLGEVGIQVSADSQGTADTTAPSQIELALSGFPAAGRYRGQLQIQADQPGCPSRSVPVLINLSTPEQIVLPAGERPLDIQLVNPASCCTGLLPPRLRPRTLAFEVLNQGDAAVQLSGLSLLLRGEQTRQVITWDSLGHGGQDSLLLRGNSRTVLRLPLDALPALSADKYTGNLEVYVEGNRRPLTLNLDLYVRDGIFWAMVAILAGVIVGFLGRSLERNKAQLDRTERLKSIRKRINILRSKTAKSALRQEVAGLEAALDGLPAKELPIIDERADTIQLKVQKIFETESVWQRFSNQDSNPSEEMRGFYSNAMTAFMNGDMARGEEELKEITLAMELKSGTKGGFFDPEEEPEPEEEMPQRPQEKAIEPSKGAWWRAWLEFLTNERKVLYHIVRPLSYVILLCLVLLWGLQELYFKEGNSTFGEDGIFDYLTLFAWGAASNILSWELVGKRLLGQRPAAEERTEPG